MSYQENFLGSSSYFYGQEVFDILHITQLMSSSSININKLESNLLDVINQLRSHYIGKPELATDSDSKVVYLCFLFEQILSHGLRNKISFNSNSTNIQKLSEYMREFNITNKGKLEFWNCISFVLPTHERERFLSLKSICTDIGRGRAWLRSALNERSLERYLKCLLSESEVLQQFYESKAWVRDKDKHRVLLKAAADISPVVFALNTDCPELNDSSPEATHLLLKHCTEPVILASPDHQSNHGSHSPYGVSPGSSPSKLRRAKRPTQSIISFDDDNRGMSIAKPVEKLPARRDEKTNVLEKYSNDLENYSNVLEKITNDLGRDSGASGTRSENRPTPSLPNSNFENSHSFPSQGNSASFGASPETVSHNASSLAQHNFSSNSSSQFLHSSDRVSSTQGSLERDNNSINTNSDMSTPNLPTSSNSDTPKSKTSEDAVSVYLTPPIFADHSTRSSQDSLEDSSSQISAPELNGLIVGGGPPISDTGPDIMSVSQYSDNRFDSSDNRSLSDLSSVTTVDDCGGSVYSSATSNNEFSGLRIMGDTGIGELTPITSYISSRESHPADLNSADEQALDATLYIDSDYTGCLRGVDEDVDSLSICSTSDGGVSSTQLHHKRGALEEKCARYEAHVQELNRENELLKHQLRKYVTAVQLLNKQHNATPSSSEAESEARLYEAKLGQLAEMHSELLEMNQRLKLDLITKEATVEKLTTELMTLRGVKPSPVSLWLPCVFLGGPPSDPHHIYQVHIRVGTEEWNVYRRYSDFYAFNKSLHRRYPVTLKHLPSSVKFPPKNLIFNKGNKSALFVEERRQKLELYLRAVVCSIVQFEFGAKTPSSGGGLNKFALVTLVPFLNDFYKSANVARHVQGGSSSANSNPIKRLSIKCLKPKAPSPTAEDALSSNHSNQTTLQYTGL
ncbi:hypothetical protein M8J76_014092 [Diaphorina citri]|nr:hypothetical protein M8J76_014092 [Diaphorina citri]